MIRGGVKQQTIQTRHRPPRNDSADLSTRVERLRDAMVAIVNDAPDLAAAQTIANEALII